MFTVHILINAVHVTTVHNINDLTCRASFVGATSTLQDHCQVLLVGKRFEHQDSEVSDMDDTAYLELAFKTISVDFVYLCTGSKQENLIDLQNYIPL